MVNSIYIHIPYCIKKCNYCDFNSYTLGNISIMEYLKALNIEMSMLSQLYNSKEIKTVFIGGGTPTILSVKEMEYLFTSLEEHYPYLDKEIEFSMEANPGTLHIDKLRIMRDYGVNRISLGVQAFQDKLLSSIGRIHGEKDIYNNLENIKKLGFKNISIDLMFGLPNQNIDMLKESLNKFFQLDIPHISVYNLIIEEGTQFYNLYNKDMLSLPSEEEDLAMYLLTIEEMKNNNYKHYEISNFSLAGFECKHNINYWKNSEYIGLGAGAHGYIDNTRYENIKGIGMYIESLNKQILPRELEYLVPIEEKKENKLMLGLRMIDGVNFSEFQYEFKDDLRIKFKKQIKKLAKLGLIIIDGNNIRLSEKGIIYGNEVFAEFVHSDD